MPGRRRADGKQERHARGLGSRPGLFGPNLHRQRVRGRGLFPGSVAQPRHRWVRRPARDGAGASQVPHALGARRALCAACARRGPLLFASYCWLLHRRQELPWHQLVVADARSLFTALPTKSGDKLACRKPKALPVDLPSATALPLHLFAWPGAGHSVHLKGRVWQCVRMSSRQERPPAYGPVDSRLRDRCAVKTTVHDVERNSELAKSKVVSDVNFLVCIRSIQIIRERHFCGQPGLSFLRQSLMDRTYRKETFEEPSRTLNNFVASSSGRRLSRNRLHLMPSAIPKFSKGSCGQSKFAALLSVMVSKLRPGTLIC
jgi:hypothetical protein